MTPKHVVIVGGSVTGLAAALALGNEGTRVAVLDRNETRMPASHVEAFEKWDRRGSPQVRHSHALLGRLYCLIRDHAPDLLAKLLACGAEELPLISMARRTLPNASAEPGDENVVLLACRRITFEYLLRRHVLDSGRVEFRDGDEVTGLATASDSPQGPPRVTGVHLLRADGAREVLHADLVADASGRRSKIGDLLEDLGAPCPREASQPLAVFYNPRFYNLSQVAGHTPPPTAPT